MTKRSAWFALRSSLWLIPLLSLLCGTVGALILVRLDLHLTTEIQDILPDFLQSGPDSARAVLSTIASSMVTVAGVVFSITIVALSLASNQYSPRVLRNFMRNRLNQTVLGVFVGVFIYCLLVLRSVAAHSESFVPHLSLWVGIGLAVTSICFLIAFIHHTATSIQASEILSHITKDTLKAVQSAHHSSAGGEPAAINETLLEDLQWVPVPSHMTGYVQDVDVAGLFNLACVCKAVVRVESPVGDFIVEGRPLVSIGGHCEIDKKRIHQIQKCFGISTYRTIEQDPAFGVREIVDIALRALSPAMNDATTAVNCVDHLGAILRTAVRVKQLPEARAEQSEIRLILRQPGPEHLLDIGFNEIRQNASEHVAVLLRLLRVVRELLEEVTDPNLAAHLCKHARLIADEAERAVPAQADKARVEEALERVLEVEAPKSEHLTPT